MSKMKIIDEIADAQVSYIKETLYDSVQWAIDGSELDHEKLHGECQPFTDREYKQVKLRGKSSYSQASKYTMHKMWRDSHEKYDLKQVKKARL